MENRIVLASASAVRRRLLGNAGVDATQRPADIDERDIAEETSDVTAKQLAVALAEAKAQSVSKQEVGAFVIGADQTLELKGNTLFKPSDETAARRQIRSLAGKPHQLHSAFAIIRDGKRLARGTRTARLTMRPLSEADIDWYLETVGEAALSSVGGYQLEGIGIRLFERVEGDYFTVLGLPILPLLAALRRIGALDR